jgi:hypothetical protein
VSLADTGVGLDASAIARLFEPYFFTKAAGTGLGLTIAKRNVELMGGRIDVPVSAQVLALNREPRDLIKHPALMVHPAPNSFEAACRWRCGRRTPSRQFRTQSGF